MLFGFYHVHVLGVVLGLAWASSTSDVAVLHRSTCNRQAARADGERPLVKEILLKGTWLIKAPRDQVYAMISDFEAMPLNFPKVARSVRIAARDGNRLTIHARAASFGSIFHDVNVVMATELLPLRGFISDNVNNTLGTAGHEEFMLRDAPGGTLIDYSYRITIRRAWLRLLAGPLVRWLGLRFWERTFIDVLRARLEKPDSGESVREGSR